MLARWRDVRRKPDEQLLAGQPSSGQPEHELLLLVERRMNLMAVQDEEGLHSGMCHALVAVHKGMIRDERHAEGCRLFIERRIQIMTFARCNSRTSANERYLISSADDRVPRSFEEHSRPRSGSPLNPETRGFLSEAFGLTRREFDGEFHDRAIIHRDVSARRTTGRKEISPFNHVPCPAR